ncbi:MAG TPA: hypothetical protein VM452_08350 [Caulifigura sp.]|jgi:hypothetical protein|nr:hypothetical protein [Caulifigura sp.]
MKVIQRASAVPVQIGGIEHSGWLPDGASQPLPTPVRSLIVDLEIVDLGHSECLLSYQSHDGTLSGDDWYASLEQAIRGAEEMFGVAPTQWRQNV